mmetsp:Transcript_42643/g.123931  ORF Transcript_42643/g.123931 Transcript_42643/m.123931 type:complete len:233 (-) Transcript_42643:288-986(-)
MTSERTIATSAAGWTSSIRWPPLIRDKCFKTTFLSPMGHPHASSCRVASSLSARLMPSAGAHTKAEKPPDKQQSTKVRGPAAAAASMRRAAAATLRSSGVGWLDSSTSKFWPNRCPTECPSLVTTTPFFKRGPNISWSASAMPTLAFPAANTTTSGYSAKLTTCPAICSCEPFNATALLTAALGSTARQAAVKIRRASRRARSSSSLPASSALTRVIALAAKATDATTRKAP